MPLYADIVLPLAQPAYTFAVPEGMHVEAGQAVAVQFGARKFYTGIVWRVNWPSGSGSPRTICARRAR